MRAIVYMLATGIRVGLGGCTTLPDRQTVARHSTEFVNRAEAALAKKRSQLAEIANDIKSDSPTARRNEVNTLFAQPRIDPLTDYLRTYANDPRYTRERAMVRAERDKRCDAVGQRYAERSATEANLERLRRGYQMSCPNQIAAFARRVNPPQAIAEADRCLLCHDAPCSAGCPAETKPAEFIRKLRFKNITGAIRTIKQNNILGGACGVLCPTSRLCEEKCSAMFKSQNRPEGADRPIQIGAIQRFLIEHSWQRGFKVFEKPEARTEKIAVVGSGPGGTGAPHDSRAGARDTHPQDAGNGTRPAAPAGTAIHRFFRARGPFQGARILILSQRGPMMRSIRRLCLRACGFHHPVAYSVTGFGYTVQLEISVE